MSYYMGDFYPRGDPGIGSFFGGLVKRAVGLIPGIGPAISTVMPGGAKVARPAAGAITAAAKAVGERVTGAIVKHPVLSAAGAAGALGTMAGAGAEMAMRPSAGRGMGGHCVRVSPKGRHIKVSCSTGKAIRRMNPCNPRALRRSVRRLHSFAKHFRHVVGFVTPHPKKGRMYFKKRRRK